jgi:hypothetical protein
MSTDTSELRQQIMSSLARIVPNKIIRERNIDYWQTVADIESLLNTEAAMKLYEGGEKKFIQMLLERGKLEVSESFPDDTVLIRIPKQTVRKYFDGDLAAQKQRWEAEARKEAVDKVKFEMMHGQLDKGMILDTKAFDEYWTAVTAALDGVIGKARNEANS